MRTQVARLNAFVQEHIVGMFIVQIFNREDAEMKHFNNINEKHRNANIKAVLAYSIFFPIVEVCSAISLGLLVWYAGKGVLTGITSQPPNNK